jgi:hypothetical protein
VTVAWVFFRAHDIEAALSIAHSMLSFDVIAFSGAGVLNKSAWNWIVILLAVAWLAPNTQQLFLQPGKQTLFGNRFVSKLPIRVLGVLCSVVLIMSFYNLHKISTFLYFQF